MAFPCQPRLADHGFHGGRARQAQQLIKQTPMDRSKATRIGGEAVQGAVTGQAPSHNGAQGANNHPKEETKATSATWKHTVSRLGWLKLKVGDPRLAGCAVVLGQTGFE